MSEERFVVGSNEIGEIIVTDVETDRVYRYGDISKFFGLIRLLNDQDKTIKGLQSELDLVANFKVWSRRKLEEDNERLRKQLEKIPKSIREVWLE